MLMIGHKIYFYGEIWLIIPKLSLLPLLIWSTEVSLERKILHDYNQIHFLKRRSGTPEAQWVKHWPTDLAVMSSSTARGEIFSTVNWVPLHTALHLQSLIVLI